MTSPDDTRRGPPTPGLSTRPRLSTHARLQWDSVREKQVLLMPEGVLVLNETAAAIVALCDGQHTVSAMAEELSIRYNQAVEADLLHFLQRLRAKNLVHFDE